MARDFGTSSPSTIWRKVIIKKEMISAIVCVYIGDQPIISENRGSSSDAMAGSPSQPRPREARVIPN